MTENELQVENKRLRAALEKIVKYRSYDFGRIYRIAKAALATPVSEED